MSWLLSMVLDKGPFIIFHVNVQISQHVCWGDCLSHCVCLALSYPGCLCSSSAFHLRVTKWFICSVKARPCRDGQNFLEQPLLELYPNKKVTLRKIYVALSWWLSGEESACQRRRQTQAQSLTREDPTDCRAPKPMCRRYWARVLEPGGPHLLRPSP